MEPDFGLIISLEVHIYSAMRGVGGGGVCVVWGGGGEEDIPTFTIVRDTF